MTKSCRLGFLLKSKSFFILFLINKDFCRRKRKLLALKLIQYSLGIIFLGGAFAKLISLESFFSQIKAYQLPVSKSFLEQSSLFLITLEALIGSSILASYRLKLFVSVAQVLLLIFIPVTSWGSLNQAPTCGCYGEVIKREPWKATIEDFLLLGLSFYLKSHSKALERKSKLKKIYKQLFVLFTSLGTFILSLFFYYS